MNLIKLISKGKARFACAALGVAIACGAVVFMTSLTSTNSAQALTLATRAASPWNAWEFRESPQKRGGEKRGGEMRRGEMRGGEMRKGSEMRGAVTDGADMSLEVVSCTIDYRPGGRVLQGPPMLAVIARAQKESPYESAPLVEGRWVSDDSGENEIVCTENTLKRFGRGERPRVGTSIKFVGRACTMTAKIVGYLKETKLPPGCPGVFANSQAFKGLQAERSGKLLLWRNAADAKGKDVLTPKSEQVMSAFKGDENKRMDYATPLLLIGAVMMALSLLVNSLLLSVESNKHNLAMLRMVGMTRLGVVRLVAAESLLATLAGFIVGTALSLAALAVYVASDTTSFPVGAAYNFRVVAIVGVMAAIVALIAVLFALRPALAVRALDAQTPAARKGRVRGMAIAFACGFAAFVAVEVWGASLMRGFVPSKEWPDAIVSVLPGGVSSFETEKLRKLPGVARISELMPLQLNFHPEQEMQMRGGARGNRKAYRNALFLAAEWLPKFKFVEGSHSQCEESVLRGEACVISEMISRSRNLHAGDKLCVVLPGRGEKQVTELPIAGVVDVNWHMVTSRGLVRGLNGAPVMTDGPVFVSFDTLESLDARPAAMTKMTHLWVEYEPQFLKEKGVFPAGREIESSIACALAQTHSTVRLHARDEIADGTLAHGSNLIGQVARIPFVFLAILSMGFVAMLVARADARKRTFVVLRAVGATRMQLTWRLVRTALVTAFYGMAAGLPIGAAAGWIAARKTGSIWPGMPPYFEVPWPVIGEGTLGALLFVLIVSVPTAMVLISRAIKAGESN